MTEQSNGFDDLTSASTADELLQWCGRYGDLLWALCEGAGIHDKLYEQFKQSVKRVAKMELTSKTPHDSLWTRHLLKVENRCGGNWRLTVTEAEKVFGVDKANITRWAQQGKIRSVGEGHGRYIVTLSLVNYLRNRPSSDEEHNPTPEEIEAGKLAEREAKGLRSS